MPLQSLELVPDAAGQAAVRADWERLRSAGLPSQADHRGASNAPHLTLLAAAELDAGTLDLARDGVLPMLPVTLPASGLVLLGDRTFTLARTVDADDALTTTVLALRSAASDISPVQHAGWLPHVTLARRLTRDQAQQALGILAEPCPPLTFVEVRHWDPRTQVVTILDAGGRGLA